MKYEFLERVYFKNNIWNINKIDNLIELYIFVLKDLKNGICRIICMFLMI